jgi:hypothetical protein
MGVSRNQAAAGALAVTAIGIGVGLILNWLRNREDDDWFSPAAFDDTETTHRASYDQTRDAGPAAMRDENDGKRSACNLLSARCFFTAPSTL